MALSASTMATNIQAAVKAVTLNQVQGAGDINDYQLAVLTAMCQAIIDEIKLDQEIVAGSTDSSGGASHVHTLNALKGKFQ